MPRFNRLLFSAVLSAFTAGSFVFAADAQTSPAKRPNFVVILSDDQGWNGTSVQMMDAEPLSKSPYYHTPGLEKLAARGMRFSSGYAPSSVCSPTRYAIQYGQTPSRLQMITVGMNTKHIAHAEMLSIPKTLKGIDPAYRTAHFGKWHLDVPPETLGYDESDGKSNNSTGGFSKGPQKWQETIKDDPKKIFGLTQLGAKFMEKQAKAGNPFYLQISHFAVHADIVMRRETLAKYKAKAPDPLHNHAGFAAMTEDLDAGVGMLLDRLHALGLEGNTYVVYLADNGSVPTIPPTKNYDKGLNYPLSRGKWDLMEGSIRVPFIVAGPGIKSGAESTVPVSGTDLLPTFADLAGNRQPLPRNLDGGSLKSVLVGGGKGEVARPIDALFFHYPSMSGNALNRAHAAVRQGAYKLIKFEDNGELWLFDLERDLGEKNNLAAKMPEKARDLERLLDGYLASVHAPRWRQGINWDAGKFLELNSHY